MGILQLFKVLFLRSIYSLSFVPTYLFTRKIFDYAGNNVIVIVHVHLRYVRSYLAGHAKVGNLI